MENAVWHETVPGLQPQTHHHHYHSPQDLSSLLCDDPNTLTAPADCHGCAESTHKKLPQAVAKCIHCHTMVNASMASSQAEGGRVHLLPSPWPTPAQYVDKRTEEENLVWLDSGVTVAHLSSEETISVTLAGNTGCGLSPTVTHPTSSSHHLDRLRLESPITFPELPDLFLSTLRPSLNFNPHII